MLEEGKLILAIPAAIKAAIEVFDRLGAGGRGQVEPGRDEIAEAQNKLEDVMKQIKVFSVMAEELEAWKTLHTLTNRLRVDLRDTLGFAELPPEDVNALVKSQRRSLLDEFTTLSRANSSNDIMKKLQNSDRLMKYLEPMPANIVGSRVQQSGMRWDFFIEINLDRAREDLEQENFGAFMNSIRPVARLRESLNNHANFRIEDWVRLYRELMVRFTDSLG